MDAYARYLQIPGGFLTFLLFAVVCPASYTPEAATDTACSVHGFFMRRGRKLLNLATD
jgi:hypothetical protein